MLIHLGGLMESWFLTVSPYNGLDERVNVHLSCPIDRGGWRAIVHGVAKSWT